MANTMSWQLVTAVTSLLVAGLTAIIPLLWQRRLRRLQLESETRVRRLEALEKALSLVGKAKSELGIEVTTHELQNELGGILHEFAGPVVLSREALEDWANESLVGRLLRTPRFSAPTGKTRFVRGMRNFSFIMIFMFVLYSMFIGLEVMFLNSIRVKETLIYCTFYLFMYFWCRLLILKESKSALKALRVMPNNTAEVKRGGSRRCRDSGLEVTC